MTEPQVAQPQPKARKVGKAPAQRAPKPEPAKLEDGLPAKKYRTYTFTIPESCRVAPTDPTTVVLRELDPDDLAATRKLTGDDHSRAADEAVKMSLVKVDAELVNHAEDGATFHWHRFSAKVRHLLNLGWASIHVTDEDEDAAFLSSMAG